MDTFKWATGLALACMTSLHAETIYISKDASGELHFSDRITDIGFVPYLTRTGAPPSAASSDTGQRRLYALHAKGDALQTLFNSAALAYRLDPDLIRAVAEQESRYNPKAISPKGAVGVMQLMPATQRQYGVRNAFDPAENVNAGARYLRAMLDQFDGDTELALGAYNAGPNRVRANGNKIPQNSETKAYVPAVIRVFTLLQQSQSGTFTAAVD